MSVIGREPSVGAGDTRELRLALVCYGGASLAIYMHGVVKEIERLVKASTLLERGDGEGSGSAVERVYGDLLLALADRHPEKIRTRVVVDVIAGTSAGGINGIYLAKALAHNRSQDALRDLWFDRGDINVLLNAPRWLPKSLRIAWVALRALHHSPLRGDEMSKWLFDALEGMDEGDPEPAAVGTLMPDDHLLELFVTVTDFYGYDRAAPAASPRLVHDQRHRHVLTFRFGEDRDDFTRQGNGALAFAARTTSCFPGVFPPVSLEAFRGYLEDRDADTSDLDRRLFRLYQVAEARPEDTWFVDGGVLDNMPFGHAIAAIKERPADLEVDRRLLYLEPAPGQPAPPSKHDAPNTVSALLGAVSGIPRHEPILDDLLDVAGLNERVQRIADIVETSFDGVAALVEDVMGRDRSFGADPADPTFAQWSRELHQRAIQEAGFSYATYIRLKISAVVDGYARAACNVCAFPPDSNHAMLVRVVLRRWAFDEGLFDKVIPPSEQQTEFLRSFDLGYGERRLRFVIAGLSLWYRKIAAGEQGYPPRADLDACKGRLYEAIETLRETMSGAGFGEELSGNIRACFADDRLAEFLTARGLEAKVFVDEHRDQLGPLFGELREVLEARLDGFSATLYRDLYELSRAWEPARRHEVLVRYFGFPFWDVLLYPIQALRDVGERDRIEVVRLSPLDARLLSPPPGELKVKGVTVHHFGAFFSREARENDYLWGRLDGAEQLVRLVVGTSPDDEELRTAWSRKAFSAILDEEEQTLAHVRPLVQHLRSATS